MDLTNITLHVEEDKIIDKNITHFDIDEFERTNDMEGLHSDHFGIYANNKDGTNVFIAETYYSDESDARRFCDECNELLKKELAKGLRTWDFVVKFQPNYNDDEIAYNDDLTKIINHEEEDGDCAHGILMGELDGDRDKARELLAISNSIVYEKAIEAFINEYPNLVRS